MLCYAVTNVSIRGELRAASLLLRHLQVKTLRVSSESLPSAQRCVKLFEAAVCVGQLVSGRKTPEQNLPLLLVNKIKTCSVR